MMDKKHKILLSEDHTTVQKTPEMILWQLLDLQDDELIINSKCRLTTMEKAKTEKCIPVYHDHCKKVHFDKAPEIQN